MHATISNRSAPSALLALAGSFRAAAQSVSRTAHRLDAWLARREKVAGDYAVLAHMSERDLNDIGLSRGYLQDAARGDWTRDSLR